MALDTTKTVTGVKYNGVAFPLDDGKDMLQARVDGDNSCAYLFYMYKGEELDVSRLNTSNVTSFSQAFASCTNLKSLDLTSWDTSNVVDMSQMFRSCTNLENIFIDTLKFNTSKVTTMQSMFSDCNNLQYIDVSKFDTSSVTNMNNMFNNCYDLTALDLTNFNTLNVIDMGYMFDGCRSLTSLDLSSFNTSKVTNMYSMFDDCRSLTSLDLSSFNTSKVTDMSNMFSGAGDLTTIQGALDLYSAIYVSNMFSDTTSLTGVTLKNIRTSLQIGQGRRWGHLWELPYLVNAFKELWDNSNEEQQTLTIGSENGKKIRDIYVKLVEVTDEMIAQDPYAANKLPCVECESADEGSMTLQAYAGLKNWGLA